MTPRQNVMASSKLPSAPRTPLFSPDSSVILRYLENLFTTPEWNRHVPLRLVMAMMYVDRRAAKYRYDKMFANIKACDTTSFQLGPLMTVYLPAHDEG